MSGKLISSILLISFLDSLNLGSFLSNRLLSTDLTLGKLYKVQFDIENGDADVDELRFKTNKSSTWRQLVTAQGGSTNADLGGSNPSIADGVITVFPKQAHIAEARGFLWLQLKVASNLVVDSDDEPTDGVDVNSTFTINEIRIIYRNLGEKE